MPVAWREANSAYRIPHHTVYSCNARRTRRILGVSVFGRQFVLMFVVCRGIDGERDVMLLTMKKTYGHWVFELRGGRTYHRWNGGRLFTTK